MDSNHRGSRMNNDKGFTVSELIFTVVALGIAYVMTHFIGKNW